jgi:adenine deaminase
MVIKGKIVDIYKREIFNGAVTIKGSKILDISYIEEECDSYILPGFVDAHVHIESSMVTPGYFAEVAVSHGTVAVVADPHEIGNVLGVEGVEFMIREGLKVPLKFFFGAPSCVPATSVESSGAVIGVEEVVSLLKRDEIKFLAEMMNFPGVISGDSDVLDKLEAAKIACKPVDGHAPGLKGKQLKSYIDAGVVTDHEATTLDEAREKIGLGMKIVIREGSAARNLEGLHQLVGESPENVMLCCDDIHPEMLVKRHINSLVRDLVKRGYNLFDVLRIASVNPVEHYNLEVGTLKAGDSADFIVVEDLTDFSILSTWIGGEAVFSGGKTNFIVERCDPVNHFNSSKITEESIAVKRVGDRIRVIEVFDGELFTEEKSVLCGKGSYVETDREADILKLVVKERYNDLDVSVGFIHGFGLKSGAFAGSIAHDSHNIIAVGVDDRSITAAINRVIEMKGGLALCNNGVVESLELNIGGIMSNVPCGTIASKYEQLSDKVKDMGCHLKSPFMTLSFMSLLVIPKLKLGDRGLFAIEKFKFVSLFE